MQKFDWIPRGSGDESGISGERSARPNKPKKWEDCVSRAKRRGKFRQAFCRPLLQKEEEVHRGKKCIIEKAVSKVHYHRLGVGKSERKRGKQKLQFVPVISKKSAAQVIANGVVVKLPFCGRGKKCDSGIQPPGSVRIRCVQ